MMAALLALATKVWDKIWAGLLAAGGIVLVVAGIYRAGAKSATQSQALDDAKRQAKAAKESADVESEVGRMADDDVDRKLNADWLRDPRGGRD